MTKAELFMYIPVHVFSRDLQTKSLDFSVKQKLYGVMGLT